MCTVVTVDDDRCDACPAEAHVQAYVFAEMPSHRTVSYCGSHGTRYLPNLLEQGATVIDLRHTISEG